MNSTYYILRNVAFVVGLSFPVSAAVTYSYDAAGRLITITYSNGSTISYTYDKGGNVLSRSIQGVSGNGPQISTGGVVGGGLSVPPVQQISPNGLISIFGQNFAPAGTSRGVSNADLVNGNLPTNFAGVCVQIGGQAAPMFFVSATQINVQVPTLSAATGAVPVHVTINCGTSSQAISNTQSVTVQAAAPEFFFFQLNSTGANPVAARDSLTGALLGDPSLLGSGFTPAKPNGYVTFYVTGLGAVTPAVQAGALPTGIASTTNPIVVTLNGTALAASDVLYAGVAPGFAGLYQVNVHIPAATPEGNLGVAIQVAAFSSPPGAFLTVKQ